MKKRILAAAIAALALCSCAEKAPESTTAPITEGSDVTVTEPVKLPDAKLTSIYELNPKHEEGSHTDETATSFLEADYRSRIEIDAETAKTSGKAIYA